MIAKTRKNKYILLIATVLFIIWMVLPGSSLQMQHEQQDAEDLPAIQIVPDGWEPLFDGKTLNGWENVAYGGEGIPCVENGALILPKATIGLMTGVRWVGDSLPVNDYIIYYEARRVEGNDIFAGLTFPYKDTFASLIFGGWGGIINGLSSIDGHDASENETTQFFSLADNRWYPVEICVTTDSIRASVGIEQVVDLATAGKELHLRYGLLDTGLTLWTYLSTGEIRNLRIKKLQ